MVPRIVTENTGPINDSFCEGRQVMAESEKAAYRRKTPLDHIVEFEVSECSTLRVANYTEAETRAEFYEDVADRWVDSPQDLSSAMTECQPLAWAVYSVYSAMRDDVVANIGAAQLNPKKNKQRLAALKSRLKKLPEEPDEGAKAWLLGLTASEYEANVTPQIEEWFSERPDWNHEGEFLPLKGTAQGAALEFFLSAESDTLAMLGVSIVDGEHPGSTYCAAELRGDIKVANAAAASHGVAVRFVRCGQSTAHRPTEVEADAIDLRSRGKGSERVISNHVLRKILSVQPGSGFFSERHTLPSGEEITHHFSHALALGAMQLVHGYRSQFGEPPKWLLACHPAHRYKLCKLALDTLAPLPSDAP